MWKFIEQMLFGDRREKANFSNLQLQYNVLEKQYLGYSDDKKYGFIVFSKNRALQLHALLKSYYETAELTAPITVLYTASSAGFGSAYDDLIKEFSGKENLCFYEQRDPLSFRNDLISVLNLANYSRIGLLVDDIIFTRKCNLYSFNKYDLRFYVPSLRLSTSTVFSYVLNTQIPIPPLVANADLFEWNWRNGRSEWGYPLSLDGNIFLRTDLLSMIECIDFRSPNTLESGLQTFNLIYLKRKGLCFKDAKLINIPSNRVQQDYDNRTGSLSADLLLEKWREGKRIKFEDLKERKFNSVHIEFDYTYCKR